MRRVVVTGMGAVTPLARSLEETWRLLLAGRSGVKPITRFDASALSVRMAGEVPQPLPSPSGTEGFELHSRFALAAAEEAVAAARLDPATLDPQAFGVVVGVGDGNVPHGPAQLAPLFAACREGDRVSLPRLEEASRTTVPLSLYRESDAMMPSAHLARRYGARGMNRTCLTACAASSQAIGEALKAIRHDEADVLLVGGSQSLLTPEGLVGFALLQALSQRNDTPEEASRPFDLERDGFILSEGAAMLVLEELEHARRRGAPILAEVTGYGASSDAFRVTDPHPEGVGAVLCMRRCVADAGLEPKDVSYINAHGTSTKANDSAESTAIKVVFGDYRVPVTSNKASFGHLIAAAGAVEFVTCVLSLRDGVIPPTINYRTPDPSCDVDLVANEKRACPVRHVLSNSFGFGGQNVSLMASEAPKAE